MAMLGWFAQTTMVAAGLAALAALIGRSRRLGPEARHLLWLVVLIKFAMPPVVAWPWLLPEAWPAPVPVLVAVAEAPASPRPVEAPGPAPIEFDRPTVDETPAMPELPPEPLPAPDESAAPPAPLAEWPRPATSDFRAEVPEAQPPLMAPISTNQKSEIWNLKSQIPRLLLALWLAGSVVVVARRAVAVIRFRRSLNAASEAPGWVSEEARAIGDRLGVRPPPILVVPGATTPMLWCLGRPRLILPASLIGRLDADRWPGIIAHELAHLARRDHWVVRLELLAEAVWWWNPVFRLARRRLREEAEHAADARVIRALPDRRFAYAEALVDVCEHLTRSAIPSPALGVGGAGASRFLEGRLLMILGDPIPRRPGRRVALAAGLLAALSLPTWTLGQQPDQPPKPDAPPRPADSTPPNGSKPEAQPRPVGPLPSPDPDLTVAEIRAGFAKRLERRGNLSFRYSVASRNRMPFNAGEGVAVAVADAILGSEGRSRLDVLTNPVGRSIVAAPGQDPWLRQFVARDESSLATFRALWTDKSSVPFRWLSAGGRAVTLGDDLAVELIGGMGTEAVERDRSIDPLDPRPRNVLDLAGASVLLLGPGNTPAQVEVAGAEAVDGREAVRVAWFAHRNDGNGGGGLRGLLWVAPTLGFAVVRSEASQDPSQSGTMHGRRAWRKSSSDFVDVGGLWLPRKVEARFAQANPDGTPYISRELVAAIEDYRASLELPPDTFHPRFKIEALDEKTGQFATLPPEPPPGLVDRLKRAVAESPFGPPRLAKPAAARRGTDLGSTNRAVGPPGAGPVPAQPDPAPEPPKADPAPAAPRAIDARPPADGLRIAAEVESRFKRDPEVIDLAAQIKTARQKLQDAQRQVRVGGDPAERKAQDRLKALTDRYGQLWEQNTQAIREQVEQSDEVARDHVALQISRRDVKAAAVLKAQAQRDLAQAVVTRNSKLVEKNPNYVSHEERIKAEAELQVAEAGLAGKKAEQAEADLGVEQARRKLGPASAPDRAPTVDSPASGGTLADLRDAVELMEVQLQGKQDSLRGPRAKLDSARILFDTRKRLEAEGRITKTVMVETEAAVNAAEVELDQKTSEVHEFEVRLRQARRRAEAEVARLKREAERARADLDRVEQLHKQGLIGEPLLRTARDRYDDLMLQLDPKHVPATAPPAEATSPAGRQ